MISVLAALLLAGHDPAADQAVRDIFDASLRDYPSSRFREVRSWTADTPRGAEAITICGKVNSPNAMGGFSGWRPFLFRGYWEPDQASWFEEPTLSLYVDRAAPLSEGEFVDALTVNADIAAACQPDRNHGDRFEFDPSTTSKAQ